MTEEDEFGSFGYSIRMTDDDKTATLEFRFDVPCTKQILVEALRAMADMTEDDAALPEFEQ